MIKSIAMFAAIVSLATASAAAAHTALESSTPPSGSVLARSPVTLTLRFREPTRLTSLEVSGRSGDRDLDFSPTGSALTFTADDPALVAGRNEIRWRALSQDGHIVDGIILIIIRPTP